ncbi:MAG: Cysteine desulfuration protein SufE [Verrucomicrobiota bacterium]|jgi:cysteine desulfuration protein SufE
MAAPTAPQSPPAAPPDSIPAELGPLEALPPGLRLARWSSHLAALTDPQVRLAQLVETARLRPPLPTLDRQETHRVPGCLVRTWWIAEWHEGRCWFRTDSDAMTLKCLAGAIAELASGGTPAEIAALDFSPFDSLGLLKQLAENRQRTIRNLMNSVHEFARQSALGHP